MKGIGLPGGMSHRELDDSLLILYKNTEIMSSATSINNILCFAATGVDNDKGGRWENDMFGPHAVKLCGKTYHMILNANNSDPSNGVSYFLFDSQSALTIAAQTREINAEAVKAIYRYLIQNNRIARSLSMLG